MALFPGPPGWAGAKRELLDFRCKGRLTEADTLTIRLGATPSGLTSTPFPQIDIIGAVVIVWRVRGKTIRSVLCNIVCNNCAQCDVHTYEQTSSSLDWVLSHWAYFTVLRSFLHVLCVLLYTVCMCRFVTRWGGPVGIEAYLRNTTSFSALTLLVGSFDPQKPSPKWPIMCLVGR